MEVIKLRQAKTFEGIEYKELNCDFDALTGEDIIKAQRELAMTNTQGSVVVTETDKAYLALIAARAANVPSDLIKKLSAKDFSEVTLKAQLFLLD